MIRAIQKNQRINVFVDKYKRGSELLKTISVSAEIKNVYCLGADQSNRGTIIYFETDKGDYVYYKEYPTSDIEYIFPLNAFCDFASAVYEDIQKNKDSNGANKSNNNIYYN